MNTKLLDALSLKNKGSPPVWLMRQAGRYMPEYRALRQKHSFLEMCHQPELIAEITHLPLKAFGMDAAILFSDILVIPEALGVGLRFDDGIGPVIERPIRTPADIEALPSICVEEKFSYVKKGIQLLAPTLSVPLIGFSGAPFTVASYMIEGGSSRDFRKTKQWMMRDPQGFHRLLTKITESTIGYLQMQINAGVQALQIFDSWAHVLSPSHFQEFSQHYLKKILEGLKQPAPPVILFCKGSSVFYPLLASIHPQGISLDWNGDMATVRSHCPKVALQGNLDPDILYAPLSTVKKEVNSLLKSMHNDPGYIFNLGHGISPDMPCDAVKVLVDTVHEYAK